LTSVPNSFVSKSSPFMPTNCDCVPYTNHLFLCSSFNSINTSTEKVGQENRKIMLEFWWK